MDKPKSNRLCGIFKSAPEFVVLADSESLAIVQMVIPSHWTPRPTIQLLNTQTTGAALVLGSTETR